MPECRLVLYDKPEEPLCSGLIAVADLAILVSVAKIPLRQNSGQRLIEFVTFSCFNFLYPFAISFVRHFLQSFMLVYAS
jgi:hypothetical protein